tara:strand:- start:937 stop:1260 length:324 start_codon:yes stop_codon:yes gene_type:complete
MSEERVTIDFMEEGAGIHAGHERLTCSSDRTRYGDDYFQVTIWKDTEYTESDSAIIRMSSVLKNDFASLKGLSGYSELWDYIDDKLTETAADMIEHDLFLYRRGDDD